jgi:hypothetical protein
MAPSHQAKLWCQCWPARTISSSTNCSSNTISECGPRRNLAQTTRVGDNGMFSISVTMAWFWVVLGNCADKSASFPFSSAGQCEHSGPNAEQDRRCEHGVQSADHLPRTMDRFPAGLRSFNGHVIGQAIAQIPDGATRESQNLVPGHFLSHREVSPSAHGKNEK